MMLRKVNARLIHKGDIMPLPLPKVKSDIGIGCLYFKQCNSTMYRPEVRTVLEKQ